MSNRKSATWSKRPIEELGSDIRIVAAAPAMLEALKFVNEWLMAGFEDSDAASQSMHPSFRKAFAKTRAAIKLAEGE